MNQAIEHKIYGGMPIPTGRKKHGYWMEKAKAMVPGQHMEVRDRVEYHSLYNAMCRLGYESTSETGDGVIRVWRVK